MFTLQTDKESISSTANDNNNSFYCRHKFILVSMERLKFLPHNLLNLGLDLAKCNVYALIKIKTMQILVSMTISADDHYSQKFLLA